jgi:hypothetical protein
MMMIASLTACGGSSASSAMVNTYTCNSPYLIEAVGWYTNSTYTLQLKSDDTYELLYRTDMFGAEDLESKGQRTIIFYGTYTTADAADGEAAHKDVVLAAATRIYFEQHDKGWGRECPVVLGTVCLDSANWTDEMTTAYDAENGTKGAKEFLEDLAQEITVTVENPTTDPDDTTLAYRIVSVPQIDLGDNK